MNANSQELLVFSYFSQVMSTTIKLNQFPTSFVISSRINIAQNSPLSCESRLSSVGRAGDCRRIRSVEIIRSVVRIRQSRKFFQLFVIP